jgi:hypothetical protein
MKMLSRMFVWRRVTATDVSTGHAQAQVHPRAADAQAVFTSPGARRYFFDLIEVCAFHVWLPNWLKNDLIIFHFSFFIFHLPLTMEL